MKPLTLSSVYMLTSNAQQVHFRLAGQTHLLLLRRGDFIWFPINDQGHILCAMITEAAGTGSSATYTALRPGGHNDDLRRIFQRLLDSGTAVVAETIYCEGSFCENSVKP